MTSLGSWSHALVLANSCVRVVTYIAGSNVAVLVELAVAALAAERPPRDPLAGQATQARKVSPSYVHT